MKSSTSTAKRSGVIIYRSRDETIPLYVAWLKDETGFHSIDLDVQDEDDLSGYSIVIMGSSMRFGKLLIREWIFKNQKNLEGKKLILFSVYLFQKSNRSLEKLKKKYARITER